MTEKQHGCFCCSFELLQYLYSAACDHRLTTFRDSKFGNPDVVHQCWMTVLKWSAILLWHSCAENIGTESSTIKSSPATTMSA